MKSIIIKKRNIIRYKITFSKNENIFCINNIYVKKELFYDFINNYLIYCLKSFKHLSIMLIIYKRKILKSELSNKNINVILYNYLDLLEN